MTSPRRYTPDLANKALPLIRPIVRDLHAAYVAFQGRVERHRGDLRRLSDDDAFEPDLPGPLREDMRLLHDLMGELRELGVTVHDPLLGRISLAGDLDGRPVRLCWKLGEASVRFWHAEGDSYRLRKPLPVALPG